MRRSRCTSAAGRAFRRTFGSSSVATLRPVVVAGPSGSGKGTLIAKLLSDYSADFGFSVSHTTRNPRPGEEDGVNYHFIKLAEMQHQINEGVFLEHASVHGNVYGTSLKSVEDVARNGKICVVEIDIQGAESVRKAELEAHYLFIQPPSRDVLEQRLRGRATETEEQVQRRIKQAEIEIKYAAQPGNFDAIVLNDDLERAYFDLKKVMHEWYPQLAGSAL